MLKELEKYAGHLNANAEVLHWLKTAGKNAGSLAFASLRWTQFVAETEHILDYLVSPAAPTRLQKMSFVDAKRKAKEWSDANQKNGRDLFDGDGDIETTHAFGDGTAIVLLKTKQAFQREGFLMNHCVGGYTPDSADCLIYSYRDAQNLPHATFEVRKNSEEIVQIKGKGNGPIHPKYIHPILEFLKVIGLDIRPSDMVNLGYHHIHADHVEFLKEYSDAWKQVAVINGESYAY